MKTVYYTLGLVLSDPVAQTGKRKAYQTAYVELFGGMKVSALATADLHVQKGMCVCVSIAPKGDGQTTYTMYELNDSARAMLASASAYMRAIAVSQKPTVLSDELPF